MTDCPYTDRIDAYHDQAMSLFEADWMAEHVRTCPACAQRLLQTRDISHAFDKFARDPMPADAKSRLQSAIQIAAQRGPARFAWEMTGIAATILVAASIWLATLPSSASASDWERAAATGGRSITSINSDQQESHLASWMVTSLSPADSSSHQQESH